MAERRRVLVVEDDAALRSLVTTILADEGYDVRPVQNGREALDMLQIWRAHAIVLDLMMPVMDGWAFRAAQRELPDDLSAIPIIVLSGAREAQSQAAKLGAAAAIQKPFDLNHLIATVGQVART